MNSTYSLVAQGCDLDSLGHINNAVYLKYLESARWDFFYQNDYINLIKNTGLMLVVLETNIRYMREIKIFDKVEIHTQWDCSDGIILNKHRIINPDTKVMYARAECRLAFIDSQRIVHDIPIDIAQQIKVQ